MSYPVLYPSTQTEFLNNGIGILSDAVATKVSETRNGEYDLTMKYPITGIHYTEIKLMRILFEKPNPYDGRQAFRIYEISKPMKGIVTVKAHHISYDLNGIAVSPFTASGAADALSGLRENAVNDCIFTFETDIENEAEFSVNEPSSIRSNLGGRKGSILDVWRGEYEFDNFRVMLHRNRGSNRGVSIRYGKNLVDIEQEENCANVYSHIYPYWKDANGEIAEISEKIIQISDAVQVQRTKIKDFTEFFEEKPTEDMLRQKAIDFAKENGISVPKVSIDLSFEQLDRYGDSKIFEEVKLCDEVNVEFPELGVSATAEAVKIVYDAILERIDHVYVGSVKSSIVDTIIAQEGEIKKKPTSIQIKNELSGLTETILGAKGGNVRMLDTDGDGMFDTLYIADHEDVDLAVKVWRFNYEGWGASENGYEGPFKMGATLDSGFIADFIKAGTLKSVKIETCDMYGTRIYASDGSGYTIMSKDGLSIYDEHDEVLIKVGYPVDEYENAYIQFGNQEKLGFVGLIKRFGNGLWFGTSAVKDITGALNKDDFVSGMSGIFVNTIESRAYVVDGKEWKNLYTGEAVARFA